MKGCKFYIGMLILLVAGLPVGCSRDAEPTMQHEIAVTTGVSGMQKRVVAINDDATLRTKDIKIDAYFHGTETKYLDGVKLHYTGTTPPWQFWDEEAQVHYYWPIEGSVYDPTGTPITVSSLDFVGFCPFAKPTYIGEPTYNHEAGVSFTCDMRSYMTYARQSGAEAPTIDEMQEFVIAVSNEQTLATQTAHNGVPMSFKHPLAQVKFVLNAASGTHVQINSIGITDARTGGTCIYDGTDIHWTGSGVNDTVKIAQTLKIGGTTETDFVYVIPDTATKYLIVNATWDDWSDVTISDYGTDVSFAWTAGHSYTYNLTIDKYGLKVDTLKFTEQW